MYQFSPSQYSTYLLCPNKWLQERLNTKLRVAGRAADFGSLVHAFVEDALGGDSEEAAFKLMKQFTAEEIDFAIVLAEKLRTYSKANFEPLSLEDSGMFNITDHIKVRFRLDMIARDIHTGKTVVVDWKTRKNTGKYMPTSESLLRDPAAIVYVWYASEKHGIPPEDLEFRLVFVDTLYRTLPPRTVSFQFESREQFERQKRWVLSLSEQMIEALIRSEATRNFGPSCKAFGGCHQKDICDEFRPKVSAEDMFRKLKGEA